jgi:potassium-dependent mechanosensitive channel
MFSPLCARVFFALLLVFSLAQPFSLQALAADPAPTEAAKDKDAAKDAPKEENSAPEENPWDAEWANQRQQLDDVAQTAKDLQKDIPGMVTAHNKALAPYSADARRMYLLASSYANNPRVLEALQNRFEEMRIAVAAIAAPLEQQKKISEELKDKIELLRGTLPKNANLTDELKQFSRNLDTVGKQLASANTRIASSLVPATGLMQSLQKAALDISVTLPPLWQQHYTEGPSNYWAPDLWTNFAADMQATVQTAILRLPLELPDTRDEFFVALLHFLVALCVFSGLSLLIYKKINKSGSGKTVIWHMFTRSVPWLGLGIALVASSWNLNNTFWHSLLALGNVALIIGQTSLAWDIRRITHEELHAVPSPMWQIYPLTLASYVLLYPNLPPYFVNVLWISIVIGFLAFSRYRADKKIPLEPDNSLFRMQPFFLWICLILALLGMGIASQILYLLYTSCIVAMQLMLGSMQVIHSVSEKQPQEGLKAAVVSIFTAMAAPALLLLVIGGMSLWLCTLPGGIILIQHYAGTSVAVGQTSFNMLSLLLIISMFYLARASISLGSTFLRSLAASQQNHLDNSLVQPFMTALTYTIWAGYGLFTLHTLGLELSSLAMVAGGLSVGIGFGLQTIVSNFLSGLILIFSRTLQEGDIIDVEGLTGTVRKISVRATMVETFNGAAIYVPNADFVSRRLINWTRNGRNTRREIIVGVAYGSDTQLVMKALRESASSNENVMKYPLPAVMFKDFGASTLDFSLLYWVRDFNSGVSTDSNIRLEIEKRFRQLDIDIAFPQMDVHVVDMPPRALARPRPAEKAAAQNGQTTQQDAKKPALNTTKTGRGHMRLIRRKAGVQATAPAQASTEEQGQTA